MKEFPPTLILRHRKENLKKCSLHGLEGRADMHFITYPLIEPLPDLKDYVVLTLDGPPLSAEDKDYGIFLIDATWRYAAKMVKVLPTSFRARSLPAIAHTAYPRRQEDCSDPSRGLASVEALYLAYEILGRDTNGLLDHYHWREDFLKEVNLGRFKKLLPKIIEENKGALKRLAAK